MAETKAVGMSSGQQHVTGAVRGCGGRVCVYLGWGNAGFPPASSTALLGPLPRPGPR